MCGTGAHKYVPPGECLYAGTKGIDIMEIDAIRVLTWGLVIPYVNCPKGVSLKNTVYHAPINGNVILHSSISFLHF